MVLFWSDRVLLWYLADFVRLARERRESIQCSSASLFGKVSEYVKTQALCAFLHVETSVDFLSQIIIVARYGYCGNE